jgi:hypothetical protein
MARLARMEARAFMPNGEVWRIDALLAKEPGMGE